MIRLPSSAIFSSPAERTAYLAAEGLVDELIHELDGRDERHDRLLVKLGPPQPAAWAQNIWFNPQIVEIASIADGARKLRAIQRNWAVYAPHLHRRATLIQAQLPSVSAKPLVFGTPAPVAPLGAWTLLDPGTILAAATCASPFPNGEVNFVEDRTGPPSRAYLKLWEALTLLGATPKPGDRAVDLGSSPGGWTWALHELGAHVVSVDKAPLGLAPSPRIDFRRESAFGLDPKSLERVDWLVSDVICFPSKIVALVERWLTVHPNARYVITVKLKGKTDMKPLEPLRSIPSSRLVHLHHNRHELTFLRTP
jgi:23S rRNA (cytidine2498-2'-O)-methyltransferase